MPPATNLPLYQRYVNGVPVPSSRRVGSVFRVREKYLILLGAAVLMGICYSAFVFLPDGPEPKGTMVKKAIMNAWDANPKDLVIPPPRFRQNDDGVGNAGEKSNNILVHEQGSDDVDPHREDDRRRLWEKINDAQIPKPEPADPKAVPRNSFGGGMNSLQPLPTSNGTDPITEQRREKIKQMMILSWDSYAKYAWGANELRPISKIGHSASIFGSSALGATIIDGMDTLYIMGLLDRFENGRKWVEMSMNLYEIRGDLSVFETNIRFVGGLLTCYALSKDELFVRRAVEVADLLLPAFDTPTGIPYALINTRTRSAKNWGWASGGASILSEFGTLHLEFEYLSALTGNPIYRDKVNRIREVLVQIEKPGGLYPNYLNPKTGKWGSRHTSVGALGDSYYEYLLKSWVVTNKRDTQGKQLYDDAADAIVQQLVQRSANGLVYVAESRGSRLDHKMDHLACFIGGLFGLHAANEPNSTVSAKFMTLAQDIAHTCHESYIRADTHLGPESFRFTNEFEAKTINEREKYYILRPEVIETYFYMWRLTKDPKYREWAWDAAQVLDFPEERIPGYAVNIFFQAIEKHCKTDDGYSGIRNVYAGENPGKDDVQQSFFLAETLKYLYLIFSPDDVISLDKWVFNTEAHPFPVRFNEEDHLVQGFSLPTTRIAT